MQGKFFDFGEVLGFGWRVMKDNILFFVGVLVILFLISLPGQILGGVMEHYPEVITPLLGLLLLPATLALEIIVGIGLIKITLGFCDGKQPKFSTLFNVWGCFWRYIGAGILYNLVIAGTFIACILPFVLLSAAAGSVCFSVPVLILAFILAAVLAIKFSLWFYFVIDKGLGPINALRASSRATMGVKWRLFVFGLLCGLINLLGVLCFGIGIFAALPTVMVAMALVYRQLSAQTPGLAEFGIGGPDIETAPVVEPDPGMQPGFGMRLGCAAEPAPALYHASDIQPDKEQTRGGFLWLAVILGVAVVGVVIMGYHFWPQTQNTQNIKNTVVPLVSNKPVALTGILYAEENPSVLIGGRIVHEEDTIDGVKVVKIHRNRVEFESGGKRWSQGVLTSPK